MNLSSLGQKLHHPDAGLLVLRVVFGLTIFVYGLGKLLGGVSAFRETGEILAIFGITFAPVFWGLLAALVEALGGLCILLGVLFRPAAALLFLTMVVATAKYWGGGPPLSSLTGLQDWLSTVGMPLAFCTAYLGLTLLGPGKFAIQKGGGGGASSPKPAGK